MADLEMDTRQINLLLSGDRKSITSFVDSYGQFMYNICFKILMNTHEAEEAAQDAVLKVLRALESYDRKSSFKGWCYTIAYRTAIDYKRKIKYTTDISGGSEIAHSGLTDDDINSKETKRNILSLLSHLEEESRLIISLFYLEEKNIKELIEITGLTESNIKIKLFRARKELAQHAAKYFENV
ncbi:MAG: sigma-70 family RNA polymerase sigma factor [Saprospiraceae bacterium]|nr:sigma-70 family RNA polymerase sigma factor [Saprospiraceae bacterium]